MSSINEHGLQEHEGREPYKETRLFRIWNQCDEDGNYGPLNRHLRDGMNRVCGLGNPSRETMAELAEENERVDELEARGRIAEAIEIAEGLVILVESEYGDVVRETGVQLEKLAQLYLKHGDIEKGRDYLGQALMTLAGAASADGDEVLAEKYWRRLQNIGH